MNSLGIGDQLGDAPITDFERDQILTLIYTSKWPLDKTEMIMKILGFMTTIRFSNMTVDERTFKQLTEASISA